MRRRSAVYAGAAALAAGAGYGWWTHRLAPPAADPAFWGATLETPSGDPLALRSLFGQPLLVNFWATWCPPCVEELPLLEAFYQDHRSRGWQLLGIAIDQPSAVRSWLQRSPLSFPIVLGGLEGSQMGRHLGNATGGLPFSLLFSVSGEILERKTGQLSKGDLQAWAARL